MDLSRQLDAALADRPENRVLIGYSGGLDSHVLLHALANSPIAWERGLSAIHVDHGLHPDSRRWAEHCRKVCAALDVPLHVAQVRVVAEGDGPEAAARNARWRAYREHAGDDDILALAQHRDDQAETLLLRLLRGAGPTGLAAMRPWSERDDGLRVWRPWLSTPRDTLCRYAEHHALIWLDDPSNSNTDLDRNHLRHDVLPLMRQRWPRIDTVLAQAADLMADARALEHDVAIRLLAHAATLRSDVLALPPLQAAPRPQRWAALRLWLSRHGIVDTGPARLERIDRELIAASVDADPRLVVGKKVLRRYRQHAYLLAADADQPLTYRLDWDGLTPLRLPDGSTLRLDPAPTSALALTVASRRGGERLRAHDNGPRRELRLLFQELAVPTWQRARWPVLWLDGEVVAFADLVLAGDFAGRLRALGSTLRFDPADAGTGDAR